MQLLEKITISTCHLKKGNVSSGNQCNDISPIFKPISQRFLDANCWNPLLTLTVYTALRLQFIADSQLKVASDWQMALQNEPF